jgi:ABC-type phosphate/phosphonate transport system substrate-binding protein
MMRIKLAIGLLLAAAILLGPNPASAKEGTVYTLGVVPTFPPVATHTRWAPFVERLSRETGLDFRLKVYETMADFERDIVSPKAPDFIFANALQIVVAHKTHGYLPLVRGGKMVRAVIFVRTDSPARTVEDLSGKLIAFVGAKNL